MRKRSGMSGPRSGRAEINPGWGRPQSAREDGHDVTVEGTRVTIVKQR